MEIVNLGRLAAGGGGGGRKQNNFDTPTNDAGEAAEETNTPN